MNNKAQNIISNILGLIIFTVSVIMYTLSRIEFNQFGVLLVVGLSLFLFKASTTRGWLEKLFNKKLK